jgi:spore maturation protein CgeB
MRIVIFTHSLISDWNHGNAHFLRGVASELASRGHELAIYEPRDGWSFRNMVDRHGIGVVRDFQAAFPNLHSTFYEPEDADVDQLTAGASLVIVHEWNEPSLVRRLGELRAHRGDFRLLFHDTHHRSVTDPAAMSAYELRHYDGVLAYGESIREIYRNTGWAKRVWTWHEAADVRVFYPRTRSRVDGDVVWIGNWGDDEREEEIREFLIGPVKALRLRARVYGVRYPRHALEMLANAGIEYGGWVPNYAVPEVFSRYRVTLHIPRRPYTAALRGIPTIRPFEAMACGIPLISAPWEDSERLFRPGQDFLVARSGLEMGRHLTTVLRDPRVSQRLRASGLETIQQRHTCAHRVDELMEIYRSLSATQEAASAGGKG